MASSQQIECKSTAAAEATLAKALAPEDVQPGDYVTPLYVIAEVPSYWWCADDWSLPRDEPVRIRYMPCSDGAPLRVTSVCLPFVLAKNPAGQQGTLDLRRCELARLDKTHGRRAWRAYKKASRRRQPLKN
jgi:hypothetical protein